MESSGLEKSFVTPKISRISMLISGISMGFVGIFITLLSKYPVYTIILMRGLFGSLFLTLFMLINKSLTRKFFLENFKLYWKFLLIIAIVAPLGMYLFVLNTTITGYAVATFLLYTNGLFLILLLILTREEKISKINIISFIFAILGIGIIMEFWNGLFLTIGIILGVLSGLCMAIHMYVVKKMYKRRRNMQINVNSRGNFDAFLSWWLTISLVIPYFPLGVMDLLKFSLMDLLISMMIGFFPTAFAYILYNIGVKNDKGGNIIILSYLEPVVATINTAIFLRNLSIFTIIGGSLIILTNILILKFSK